METVLGEGFYPQNAQTEWTDFAYLDGTMYAAFGTDTVMCQAAPCQYVEVESDLFASFIAECKEEAEEEKERRDMEREEENARWKEDRAEF